jgi:hypothetical protein
MTDYSPPCHTPPSHWATDQARAWRLVAAIMQHDGALFDVVADEVRADGYQAVDRLLAALARNLLLRVRLAIGWDELDEIVAAELIASAEDAEHA